MTDSLPILVVIVIVIAALAAVGVALWRSRRPADAEAIDGCGIAAGAAR